MSKISKKTVAKLENRSRSNSEWDPYSEQVSQIRSPTHGLFDGLPIQHITKDEWDQMGAFTSPVPTIDHPVTYIEQGGKYKETGPSRSGPKVREKLHVIMKTPIELAIIVQKAFNNIYIVCQGFLGGLALAHLFLVCSVGQSYSELVHYMNAYSSLARPYQALFYILILVCMMSILDRCDFCNFKYFSKLMREKPLSALTVLVCGTTLVISCHTSYWDHRLSTRYHNITLLEEEMDFATQLGVWKTLSTLRCVGGIVTWLLVSILPSSDGITFHLTAIQQVATEQ